MTLYVLHQSPEPTPIPTPSRGLVEATGLEPVTFALQTQCSSN